VPKAWILAIWILGPGFESLSRHGCLSSPLCVFMSSESRGLASNRHPVQGVIPNVKVIHNFRSNSELK
jgi:hypothetical protein